MIIKVMTFNIQHCRDYIKRVIDVKMFARQIKNLNPDIIGLNEVYGEYDNNRSQAEEIAEELGYHYYFGKAIDYRGIPYGNALLSKYKINNPIIIEIPDPIKTTDELYETRCIIKASILNFTVLVSHFGLVKSEQENAVKTAAHEITKIKTPIILMGDFNMESNDPTLLPINNLLINTLDEGLTYPSINPTKKIDYIYVSKDIEILDAEIPKIVASDHLPHTAILKIK